MGQDKEVRYYGSAIELLEDLRKDGITGYELKKEFDKFLDLQARMRGVPINVGFELTPLCNFDCKMCYVHLTKEQMEKEGHVLTTEQWLDIMAQAADAGMLHADLTGGECLTHPGFKQIYLYLRSRGIQISVLTNGQLINEEMADFFAENPPSLVQITVYGSNEDAYERVTGRRAFADVLAAIERLKQRKIRVMLTLTPSQYTQEDTHALLSLLRSLKVEYGVGGVVLPAREDTGRKIDTYSPEDELCVKIQEDERDYSISLTEAAKGDTIQPAPRKQIERIPKNFAPHSGIPCASGQSTCHINWKGEMQPCIPFYTVARSVLEYGYADAWQWVTKTMASFKPPEECRGCKMLPLCRSCTAEKTSGVLNGPLNRAVCHRYTSYLEAGIIELAEKESCI